MPIKSQLIIAADVTLVVHALFVSFVVLGLIAIYTGRALNWGWVRNSAFRLIHLLSIGVVVFQSWLGLACPLTTLEMALRRRANAEIYEGSFIQHWLHKVLYFDASDWVFVVLYSGFGALVLASWYLVPPGRTGRK